MAHMTITVSDTDLAAAGYKIDFAATGTEIDDGQATAAYFTGFFLYSVLETDEFEQGLRIFGRDLIDQLDRDCPGLDASETPMTMKIHLVDEDLETGRCSVRVENASEAEVSQKLPTTAQVVAGYIRFLLTDMAFREASWAFAEEYVKNKQEGAYIGNPESAPTNLVA